MGENKFNNMIHSQFSITQVGYIAQYVEPISCFCTLGEIKSIFDNDDKITSIPIEKEGGVVGLISKETITSKSKSAWAKFQQHYLEKYKDDNTLIINAEENANKALDQILSSQIGHVFDDFLIYYRSKFFAVGNFLDLTKHIANLNKLDLEMAREIQEYLMNRSTIKSDIFQINTFIKMAHELGGDFYQFFKVKDNLFLVSSFDVSGKNISASLSTCMINSFFHTLELSDQLNKYSPLQILERFNDFVIDQTPKDVFIAGLFIFIDTEDHKITLYNFGYTPVYMFQTNEEGHKTCKIIKANISPLGIKKFEDINKYKISISIQKDLRFFVYSDGLTDARDIYGELYGEDRLKKFLSESYKYDAGTLLKKIEETITDFIGEAPQADDITSIVVQF